MLEFDPKSLAVDCGGTWRALPTERVRGFSIDTRKLRAGDLFVALRTERRDGHAFIGRAAELGASGVLVSQPVEESRLPQMCVADTLQALQALARAHRRRFTGRIVGITGSAGKTSTKDLLAVLLDEGSDVLATEGNLNNHLGVPLTLLRLDPEQHRCAVIEAGISAPGEMCVLAELIRPDVAIVTTVAAAHLEGLGSVARIAEEKSRLAAETGDQGVAVFPSECLVHESFRRLRGASYVSVPMDSAVNRDDLPASISLIPSRIEHEGSRTGISVTWEGETHEFEMRRVTTGMAANAILAIITAQHLGISADNIQQRLRLWKPAALRGEVVSVGGRLFYLDCYNANPLSMADALEGFVAMTAPDAPRLFVVGCMEELGEESAEMHRALGRTFPIRPQDHLIAFGRQADELAAGIRATLPVANLLLNPERSVAEEAIRTSSAAVFVKGSRAYRLEELINRTGWGARHEEETAA